MGVLKLAERINDPASQEWYDGIFPKDTQVRVRVFEYVCLGTCACA